MSAFVALETLPKLGRNHKPPVTSQSRSRPGVNNVAAAHSFCHIAIDSEFAVSSSEEDMGALSDSGSDKDYAR